MKKFLFLLMPCLIAASDGDYEYKVAMEFASGGRGAQEEVRDLPSCPYERCEGMIEVKIVKKDYKEAMKWFNKAIAEGNKNASVDAFKILFKQIDYKSKKPDDYLLEKMKENFGLTYSKYTDLIQFYLDDMVKNKTCAGFYYTYEAYQNGYFGFQKDQKKAQHFKKLAHETCPKKSIYFLLTS